MKRTAFTLLTAIAGLVGTFSATASAAEPYPLDYWAVRAQMQNVEVSPDGKYVAFLSINSKEGNPIINVYETADLSKEPFRAGGDSLEVTNFYFVGDAEMIVSFRGQVSSRIDGFNQGAYRGRLTLLDLETGKFKALDSQSGTTGEGYSISFENRLASNPDQILVSEVEFSRRSAFRQRSYYRYNLNNGSKQLILKGREDIFSGSYQFDSAGNPRGAVRFDENSNEFVYLYRKPEDRDWQELYRLSQDSFEQFTVEGIVDGTDNLLYVTANNGRDRQALWIYNADTNQFEDLVFEHPEVDVAGMAFHSNDWSNPGVEIAVAYSTDRPHREYLDTQEAASEKAALDQLTAAIPNAYLVRITSRSRDGQTLIVQNTGPRDPGSYYLLANGQFQYLGGRKPLLKADQLADVRYISYPARDGRTIHGYVTVPNGKPPFPLVVLPHGGPFVGETIVFDEWGQLLANNGYMVLQPQYRGSQKYGLDYYTSAFLPNAEGGRAMQDDKDDGALYLVREGLADPDRLGFFGWSYGGYAALIAAARTDQIYQCSIAGAAVADTTHQVNYYRNQLRGSQRTEQLAMWTGSVNPIEEVANVNIPLLIVHGSIDQRVPPEHAKFYTDALDRAGKNYQYVELKDADHFSNTLFYRHKIALYEKMIDFFKNDCGPGGL